MRATTLRVLSGVWRASLLALAFSLPFELTTPLIAAPWFVLTNVELLAGIAIALLGGGVVGVSTFADYNAGFEIDQ